MQRFTLFGPDKRVGTAELSVGDCAYIPRNAGHSIQNIGPDEVQAIAVLDSGVFQENTLSDWIAKAPRHLLANNFGVPEASVANLVRKKMVIVPAVTPV